MKNKVELLGHYGSDMSEINEGHYLEMMDRLHVIMCNINDHCLEHPVAKRDIRIKSLLEKTIEELWDAYQIVGQLDYENNES
jgi:hypothetical protein